MKNQILVTTKVTPLLEQTNARNNQYAYSYTITIRNNGEIGVKLLTRYWFILDENNHTEEVAGEGVVGQQPHIQPGEQFVYSSGAIIKTPTGSMKGTYSMISDEGENFDAIVPEFALSEPYTLH